MNCIVVIASDTFCLSLKSVENLGKMGTRRELHKALPACMQLLTASDAFSMTLLPFAASESRTLDRPHHLLGNEFDVSPNESRTEMR